METVVMLGVEEHKRKGRWLLARAVLFLVCWILSFPLAGLGLLIFDTEDEQTASTVIVILALTLFVVGIWRIPLPSLSEGSSRKSDPPQD
jgi:hypothetical protein